MKNEIEELVSKFVLLPSEEKPKEIITTLKEDIAVLHDLCKKFEVNIDFIANREMIDISKSNVSNDDYYEAIFAYIKSFENINGILLLVLSEIIENGGN